MQETLFNYPEYAEVNGKKYKINTDFRVAIKCNNISMQDIDIIEKTMAIIYLLYGEQALNDVQNYEELVKKAIYFLHCGDEKVDNEAAANKEPDMDFIQDMPYIEASFMSDYGIALESTKMHWWKFYRLISSLSNSELGNCCILNRIRNLRTMDLNDVKDAKQKRKLKEAKKLFALKKPVKEKTYSQEELASMEAYHKLVGD